MCAKQQHSGSPGRRNPGPGLWWPPAGPSSPTHLVCRWPMSRWRRSGEAWCIDRQQNLQSSQQSKVSVKSQPGDFLEVSSFSEGTVLPRDSPENLTFIQIERGPCPLSSAFGSTFSSRIIPGPLVLAGIVRDRASASLVSGGYGFGGVLRHQTCLRRVCVCVPAYIYIYIHTPCKT